MALRTGIAGFGLAGRVFHAPLIRAVQGLHLHAVLTRSPERAARARAEHPDVRVAEDLDALLAGLDVLVVATANSAHVDVALAGLKRGLAVVVDKPLAPTASDARRLLAAGGRLTLFQNRRWDGDFLTVQRLLREGALGAPTRLESRFERFRPQVDAARWREQGGADAGGGVLLDLGAHLVDQAVQLFGPPLSVCGEVHARRPGAQVDDDAFVALEHAGGVRSHLWMSQVAPAPGPRLRVSGLQAGFVSEAVDPQEEQLAAGLPPDDPRYGVAPPGRLGDAPLELERGRYAAFYEGVRDWARGDGPPPVDPADGARVLEILEAAARSSARRETVLPAPAD